MKSFIAILLLSLSSMALADLQIYPFRAALDSSNSSSTFNITNTGDQATSIRFSLQDHDQAQNGNWEKVASNATSAKNILKFSPRQTTLAPGQSQTVRVFAKGIKRLPAGELRSHLLLQQQPSAQRPTANNQGISAQVEVLYGISVPVVVRSGTPQVSAQLRAALAADGVAVTLQRQGNQSLYGRIVATDARGRDIAVISNAAVHVPYRSKDYTIPFQSGVSSSSISLPISVQFSDADRPEISASTMIN